MRRLAKDRLGRLRVAAALCAVLALAGAAAAATGRPLDAADAKRTFFGVDMSGVMPRETGGDVAWRECVDPAGETVYWFAGEVDRGRLRIREDGALCFSYKSTGYAEEGCFAAYAEAKGQYRFVGLDGESTFLTKRLRKGVKACSAQEMVS